MSNVGYDTFFPKRPSTKFIVKNVSNEEPCHFYPKGKVVRVFNYPIAIGDTRDLLAIPGVSEADIRHALLKGELQLKLGQQVRELIVVDSDIDLLQFNDDQKEFLKQSGITKGLEIEGSGGGTGNIIHIEDASLVGLRDNVNTIFTIPSGKFRFDEDFKILIYRNGVRQRIGSNYSVSESGGLGTGYDTITFVEPAFSDDELVADYYPVASSGTIFESGLSTKQHETLRQLIHLADGVGGPMTGFASGAFREILPINNPLPTSIVWWDSSAKTNKIVEKLITYDGSNRIILITWNVYDVDNSLLANIVDIISYTGASVFESSRTRIIS